MRKSRFTRLVLLGCAGLALAAGGFALAGTQSLALTSVGPTPDDLTVRWGDTLVVKNSDTVSHSLVSSHPELQTGALAPGATYTTLFSSRAHSYGYRQIGGRGFPGKIVIDFAGSVSLKVSSPSVLLGRSVTLSGVSSFPGTPVAIQLRRRGATAWAPVTTLTSGASGAFKVIVRLERGGKLRATVAAGEVRSRVATLAIRPTLVVGKRGGTIRARLTPAHAARRLTLECRIGPGRWKRLTSKRPNAAGLATFRVGGRKRVVVRVAAVHHDVADGFASQASRGLRVSASC
jgi:hypothetical protein